MLLSLSPEKVRIIMKRETINKIANFILTVITAFVSTFLMQSCGVLH